MSGSPNALTLHFSTHVEVNQARAMFVSGAYALLNSRGGQPYVGITEANVIAISPLMWRSTHMQPTKSSPSGTFLRSCRGHPPLMVCKYVFSAHCFAHVEVTPH